MTNAEIARIFREIAVYLDMDNVPFRPRADERAAYAIDALDRPLARKTCSTHDHWTHSWRR